MKKLITAAMTLALAAGLASAQVTSDNTVGYNTVTIRPGYNMLAVNWDLVANTTAGIGVQNLLDTSALKGGLAEGLGDNIKLHDASTGGFSTIYLYDGGETSYHENDGLWLESNKAVSTRTIPVGQGFWYFSRGTNPAGWSWGELKPYTL